jgi:hypothetical protein
VVIKTDRFDKTEIKKFFLKISGHQQRWSRPLPGAILIPPALLVVADWVGSGFGTAPTILQTPILSNYKLRR